MGDSRVKTSSLGRSGLLLLGALFVASGLAGAACGAQYAQSSAGRESGDAEVGRPGEGRPEDAEEPEKAPSPTPTPTAGSEPSSSPPLPPLVLHQAPAANHYLSLSEIEALLRRWAADNPRVLAYGEHAPNINGQKGFFLRISSAVGSGAALPPVLVTAATHGDEKLSTATALGAFYQLLQQVGRDAAINSIFQTRDVYLVPVACPDGYARNAREVENGWDPNRGFAAPVASGNPQSACGRAMESLFLAKGFRAVLDYHASGRMVMLPWSHTRARLEAETERRYRALAKKMADASAYRWGQIPDMVGYTAPGSSGDFYYIEGKKRGWNTAAMAVEVGVEKQPGDATAIAAEIGKNVEMLKLFLKEAPELIGAVNNYASGDAAQDDPPLPVYSGISPYFVPGRE